jgi:hypothetical protein
MRQLSSPKNLISPSKRNSSTSSFSSSTNLSPSRWVDPPSSKKSTLLPLLQNLEQILIKLNDYVYKPLGNGNVQAARRAARRHMTASSTTAATTAAATATNLWAPIYESWTLHDIALFEAGFALYGKDFVSIQQIVGSKTNQEIVDFFYLWKMTSHYRVWKRKMTRSANERATAEAAANVAAAAASLASGIPRPIGASNLPLTQFWGDGVRNHLKKKKSNKRRGNDDGGGGSKNKSQKRKKGLVYAKLHGVEIKPELLRASVNSFGGIEAVRSDRKWQLVRVDLKLKQASSSGHTLNKAWIKYFES